MESQTCRLPAYIHADDPVPCSEDPVPCSEDTVPCSEDAVPVACSTDDVQDLAVHVGFTGSGTNIIVHCMDALTIISILYRDSTEFIRPVARQWSSFG